ncbi:hypothetical protein A2U01_0079818, partial [Trifolium medium]|nr:hypothetical protein [Trifolium medium]
GFVYDLAWGGLEQCWCRYKKIVMGFEDASLAEALGLREAMAMVDRL